MRLRPTLRRWHIWLGWLVGLPMLFWTVSGVIMVWKPIEEVRGTDLLAEPPAVRLAAPPVPPQLTGIAIDKLTLEPRADGPRWVVQVADGSARLADPSTGRLLPSIGAAEAAAEVIARYTGSSRLASVRRTSANDPPLDLRRPVAAWAVEMSDGTRFYVDAGSGEVIARRTRWWRLYDWMWGLHIMDLETHEDSHNPWVLGFGLASLLATAMALLLLPLASVRGRGRRRTPPPS